MNVTTAPITRFAYEKIKLIYWVLDSKTEEVVQWKYWVNGLDMPPNVNGAFWRRPTYEEALVRQWHYANDPVSFEQEVREVANFATRLRKSNEPMLVTLAQEA